MKNRSQKSGVRIIASLLPVAAALWLVTGCSTLDRAYDQEVTLTEQPVVHVYTNTVVVTNFVPTIIERTNVVLATNALPGEVTGHVVLEPVATNVFELVQTNYVRVFETNFVSVPVTNLVARPGAESMIQGAAMITNTLAPGLAVWWRWHWAGCITGIGRCETGR